jgi:hypothetical protein
MLSHSHDRWPHIVVQCCRSWRCISLLTCSLSSLCWAVSRSTSSVEQRGCSGSSCCTCFVSDMTLSCSSARREVSSAACAQQQQQVQQQVNNTKSVQETRQTRRRCCCAMFLVASCAGNVVGLGYGRPQRQRVVSSGQLSSHTCALARCQFVSAAAFSASARAARASRDSLSEMALAYSPRTSYSPAWHTQQPAKSTLCYGHGLRALNQVASCCGGI